MNKKQWLPNGVGANLIAHTDEINELRDELYKLRKFKEYFDDLYGQGLEIENWHLNGSTEPFDNFYEQAISSLQPIKKDYIHSMDFDLPFLNEKPKEYKSVWANALLSDNKILFWYIGNECKSKLDFYKDFYYAGIQYSEYEKEHKLKLVKKEFTYKNGDSQKNNYIFDVLAPDYFKNFEISPDNKGQPPY